MTLDAGICVSRIEGDGRASSATEVLLNQRVIRKVTRLIVTSDDPARRPSLRVAERHAIGEVIDAVTDRNPLQKIRIDALKATDIEAKLVRLGTPSVVSVDAAPGTKVVLCCPRMKFIDGEKLLTLQHAKPLHGHGTHGGALAAAHGTGTATDIAYAFRQIELQHHATAMAAGPVCGLDDRGSDLA